MAGLTEEAPLTGVRVKVLIRVLDLTTPAEYSLIP